MNLETRIGIETRIVKCLIATMLKAGYTISVDDGDYEEYAIKKSTNESEILDAIQNTDMDTVIMHDATTGKIVGSVLLVYGNDGYDVINDYSLRLETALAPVIAYAEQQEVQYG